VSQSTPRDRAASLLKFLGERLELFERFHSANYRLVLQSFFDFFDRDDVIGEVQKVLARRAPTTAKAWYERAVKTGAVPPLPDVPAEAFAMRYALLKHVRMDKVDLRYFATNHVPGGFLDEKLMHYKRLVAHPFAADCRTFVRLATARLEGEWVDVGAVTEEVLDSDAFAAAAFGPRPWNDEDDRKVEAAEKAAKKKLSDAPAPAPAPPVEAARAAPAPVEAPAPEAQAEDDAALVEALRALDAAAAEADGDLRLDLLALRIELGRATRRPDRLAARLDDLAGREELAEALDLVRGALAG
jgi:hypothetical protein